MTDHASILDSLSAAAAAYSALLNEVADLRALLAAARNDIAVSSRKAHTAEQAVAEITQQRDALAGQLAQAQARCDGLAAQLSQQVAEATECEQCHERIKALEEEIKTAHAALVAEKVTIGKLREDLNIATKQVGMHAAEASKSWEAVTQANARLHDAEAKLETSMGEARRLFAESQSLREAHEAEVQKLRAEMETVSQEREQTRLAAEQAREQTAVTTETLATVRKDLGDVEAAKFRLATNFAAYESGVRIALYGTDRMEPLSTIVEDIKALRQREQQHTAENERLKTALAAAEASVRSNADALRRFQERMKS